MDDWENDEKFDATTIKTVLPSVAIYIPEGSILNTELVADFAKKGFTRFGCLMADTDAVSFMLAIQGKPKQADKGYQLSDTHLMEIWVNSSKFESRTRAIQSEQ